MRRTLTLLSLIVVFVSAPALARQPISGTLFFGGQTHDVDVDFTGTTDFEPEDSGDTLGAGISYAINDNWHVNLDWLLTDTDDTDITNVTVGVNYRFPLFLNNLYGEIGAFLGEGKLDWQGRPDEFDPTIDDLKSREFNYGPYLGLHYDMSEHWSASLGYRYMVQKFETSAEIGSERIVFEHDNIQVVLFGLRYHL